MTPVEFTLLILWLATLFTLGTEWLRANGEQDRADDEAERADRAASFAQDCLDTNDGLISLLNSYRRVNGHLCAYIRDGRNGETFVADLLASEESTPIFDETAQDTLRAELDDNEALRRWLDV